MKRLMLTGLMLSTMLLSSCSSYSGKFACADSKGSWCKSLSQVDQMVDSGEIEQYHQEGKKGKLCLFGSCGGNNKNKGELARQPPLVQNSEIKAKIEEPAVNNGGTVNIRRAGEYLYVE